jgi:hypothetical protein
VAAAWKAVKGLANEQASETAATANAAIKTWILFAPLGECLDIIISPQFWHARVKKKRPEL